MGVNNFASIQVSLASPERIREWSYGEVKSRKRSITVPRNRNGTACSVKEFSVRAKTGNVIAENIKKCAIKG